ncbi:dol-P-Glc:Glc(2)Man(9)GlcNAc(2)-PP-Dol alpha-1,2-glucosyltransferase-like [Saccoglossus kowalevskii]
MAAPNKFLVFQAFLSVGAIFFGTSVLTLLKIDRAQSEPYMDEIFHIPQAQKYCNGSFDEWDPMITTPPGLYLVTVGLLKPVSWHLDIDMLDCCIPTILRSTNIMFAMGNLYLLYSILVKLNPDPEESSMQLATTAITLAMFPLLYFFTFLYYTDAGSTFFVLFMYLLSHHGNHMNAILSGACAVAFRQTNIIWVVFVAGVTAARLIEQDEKCDKVKLAGSDGEIDESSKKEKKEKISKKRKEKSKKMKEKESSQINDDIISIISKNIENLFAYLSIFSNIGYLAQQLFPYAIIVIAFMVFVHLNEGIVLGDKSNHQACLNFPQLFYFFTFSAVFSFPYFISPFNIIPFLKFLRKNRMFIAVCFGASLLMVYMFTYVHPYILADNRHYPFYIWKNVYQRHYLVKYALIPGYFYAGWCIFYSLSHRTVTWNLVFAVCLAAAVVPQRLIEFRYFIVPYLIFRLHMKLQPYALLFTEAILYFVINYITIRFFVHETFTKPDSDEIQRFMW